MTGGVTLPRLFGVVNTVWVLFQAKKTYAKETKLSYNIVNVQIIGVEAAEQFRAWDSFR